MSKSTNKSLDYFKLILFVLFLAELFLFLILIIYGRFLGYDNTFKICFWLGVIVAGCFVLIVLANFFIIMLDRFFRK